MQDDLVQRHAKEDAKCLIQVYRGPNMQSHTNKSCTRLACLANPHTFTALVTYHAVQRSRLQLLAQLVGTKLVSASNDDNDIEREILQALASQRYDAN